jgi:hypothetical protein
VSVWGGGGGGPCVWGGGAAAGAWRALKAMRFKRYKRASFQLTDTFSMPLVFSRAFCSSKGCCDKPTLMHNVACAHALRHPDHHVMMLDFSETGDISTLALGGFIGTAELGGKGKAMAEPYWPKGIATTDSMPLDKSRVLPFFSAKQRYRFPSQKQPPPPRKSSSKGRR